MTLCFFLRFIKKCDKNETCVKCIALFLRERNVEGVFRMGFSRKKIVTPPVQDANEKFQGVE